MDLIQFDAFMPHGMCYMWRWDMLLLQVGSDLLIAMAYFSIPAAMIVLLRNRPDVPRRIFKLFVAFILLCGITHLISVVVVWEPLYLLQGLAKLATAIVSVATAIILWPLIPKAIAMPSVQDLEARSAEIAALNKRLEQRLDSLSTLAGGVSHEFNNLLTVISGNVELLQNDDNSPDEQQKLFAIAKASRRCADTCAKMMAYSGKGHFVLEEFDLGHFVEQASLRIPPGCELHSSTQKKLAPVQASRKQLQQLLEALVDNAAEAIEELPDAEGNIEISVSQKILTENDIEQAAFECNAEPGSYVVLEVSDDGVGMDEASMERIFDPYYSTKFTGRGLGLAAVQGIVRGHDACLFISSQPGQGTRIQVAFPVARASSEQYQTPRCDNPRTVLIVDDEEPVLALARKYLEEFGMQVLTASDSKTALQVVRENGEAIDVVILDYLMPDETGLQLLDKISRVIDVDTYLTSGFSRGEISDPDIRRLLTGFIAKPFSREDLQHLFGDQTGDQEESSSDGADEIRQQ